MLSRHTGRAGGAIVNAARLFALDAGVEQTNTVDHGSAIRWA
jgi:hypothetical protein